MELTDDQIRKLSADLQPTIDALHTHLQTCGLTKTQALSVLLVLAAMYLDHVADLEQHARCAHFQAEKCVGKVAGKSLMSLGPAVIFSCLTEWSLELPATINTVKAMVEFDREVGRHAG